MARNYTLKRRAESQTDTRLRIVEAAIALHSTIGPANTTVSMIAEKAGVQRNTFYAHFPDERRMFMACSGHALEQDPLPNAETWRGVADPVERLKVALPAIYAWFDRNAGILACVLRDAEHLKVVREILALRYAPEIEKWHETLGVGLTSKRQVMLALALSFHTWRTLTRDAGLKQSAAVKTMVEAIVA